MSTRSTAVAATTEMRQSAGRLPRRAAGTHLPKAAYRGVARVPSSAPDPSIRWRDDEQTITTLLAALRREW